MVVFFPNITCYFEFHFGFLFYSDAAIVMLSGQMADGFTTIVAGELVCSDRGKNVKMESLRLRC